MHSWDSVTRSGSTGGKGEKKKGRMEGEITSTAKKLVATGTSGLVLLETEMQTVWFTGDGRL